MPAPRWRTRWQPAPPGWQENACLCRETTIKYNNKTIFNDLNVFLGVFLPIIDLRHVPSLQGAANQPGGSMQWFYDLKIARKLMLAFSLMLVLISGMGVLAVNRLGVVNDVSNDIATDWLPAIRSLAMIKLDLARVRSFEMQRILALSYQDGAVAEEKANHQIEELLLAQNRYAPQVTGAEQQRIYTQAQQAIQTLLTEHPKIMALMNQGRKDEAIALLYRRSTAAYRLTLELLEKLVAANDRGAAASNADADATYAQAKTLIYGLLLASVALALLLAAWIARIIAQPLRGALEVATRVADGDLSTTIVARSADETGELVLALAEMNGKLLQIVTEVRGGTELIATASAEIAAGNLDLSAQRAGGSRGRRGRGRRMRRRRGRRHHGRHRRGLRQDRRHHRRHRRHRLPDQHPGAERGRGGGPGRRTGPRLRRRRHRSALPGGALGHGGTRDQGADRRFGGAGA